MREIKYEELLPDFGKLPDFEYTDDIEAADDFVGQERARKALSFGVQMPHKGYNIFVVGPTGTGRRTFVQRFLENYAQNLPVPKDWAYVYNFEDPSSPIAISMEAGVGRALKRDMEKLVDEIISALSKAFESDEYSRRKNEIEDSYTRMKNELWDRLREQAKELGFTVQITPTGVLTIPVIDGKPITPDLFEVLPEEKKKEIEENSIKVKHLVEGAMYRSRKLDAEMKEKLEEIDRQVALFAIGGLFEELRGKYRKYEGVVSFLESVKEDVLENLSDIRKASGEDVEVFKTKYSINLIVDNSQLKGAPVVYEQNPTYSNLFGKVEYTSRLGMLMTDFTMIKGGAVHRASGGFLILDAESVLKNIHAWEGLKRVLRTGQIKIENLESALGLSNVITLSPQPIPVDLKVIMIGTPYIYELLYELDEDFRKLFKVKAEFDGTMKCTEETARSLVSFVEGVRKSLDLPKFSRSAVKAILWYSNRLSGDREKLSARFGSIRDLIVEAAAIAREKDKEDVSEEDVKKALEEMEERVRLLQEKYDELIEKGDLLIETSGKKVGQVNGLTVLDIGDHTFGVPVKITAKTFLGKTGVIDIHREVDLSGKIHSKAVLTLEGFFSSRYSQKTPLSLAASLSFEQVYSRLEGDSASLAEVLALISAIAEVPLRQDVAVTGSINQNGDVQPVGGVTEKVEGFFRACKAKRLTGTQGVIIPKANVRNLVLKDEVLEAVKEGKFHIWTVESVDEAIEIMTGMKAGKVTKRGYYQKGTVNRMVCDRLKEVKELLEGKEKRRKK